MKKIMIVEDDQALGQALKDHFERNGFEIIWAQNADLALPLMTNDISMIFLDINLPGSMDGFGLLRKIKHESSPSRNSDVVMLTNMGEIDDMEKAHDFGASDYIIKSNIDLDKLLEFVHKKIGRE